ncbi:uncharacterized protein LOC126665837 [Mercurialis annua]|uniref:uncharacterized protein LOC126665837 n=1 Tax=Mercurialis annua TaxID=3986 RepID=UPI00215F3A21|nr:uncharacterized protein LOC126665837 [Mercurialis annua]
MKKQDTGKDQKDTNSRVIITVYVESPRKRLHQKTNPTGKHRGCYDRRSDLLAYSRQLRNGGSPRRIRQPERNSPLTSKMWKWSSLPVRIKASFRKIFRRSKRQFRYERIPSEAGQFSRRRKKSWRRHIASSCCRKMKDVLKEISRGFGCRK